MGWSMWKKRRQARWCSRVRRHSAATTRNNSIHNTDYPRSSCINIVNHIIILLHLFLNHPFLLPLLLLLLHLLLIFTVHLHHLSVLLPTFPKHPISLLLLICIANETTQYYVPSLYEEQHP